MLTLIGRRPVPTLRSVIVLELVDDGASRPFQGPIETTMCVLGEVESSSDRQMHRLASREGRSPGHEESQPSSAVARSFEGDKRRAACCRWQPQLSCGLQLGASGSQTNDESFDSVAGIGFGDRDMQYGRAGDLSSLSQGLCEYPGGREARTSKSSNWRSNAPS